MDELESRLEHDLSGLGRVPLAEPEPVADLHRRARRMRAGRMATSIAAVSTAVVLVGAVVVAVNNKSADNRPQEIRVSAPGFVLGDIDAVVLSAAFDADGARAPLPPDVAATVARVPGVKSVSGVIDTFAPIVPPGDVEPSRVPPRSPILFSFHKDDDINVVSGRAPAADDEIVVDADFLTRNHVQVGDTVPMRLRTESVSFKIVGTFGLPGVDLTGIPLAAMSAAHQRPSLQLDRIDVNVAPGTDLANVRDAITSAVGNNFTVAPPSAISFADQRLAQVEIQRAYWALLSPDQNERTTSGIPADQNEKGNYAKYSDLAKMVELRVENVTFLSADAASLTYRIYYGGGPSPIIDKPQSGTATRVKGHWQLGTNTLCSLAALVGIECKGTDHVTITPPNGYQPVGTLEAEIARAFRTLADPNATASQRIAAVANGDEIKRLVEAGVAQDHKLTKARFTISGWRALDPATVEILYSLETNGPSTPWPSTATAVKQADGHWYAQQQYGCGIGGLSGSGCAPINSPAVAVNP